MHGMLGLLIVAAIGADEELSRVPPSVPLPKICKPRSGDPQPLEIWNLSLPDAIRIGLDNSESARVISCYPLTMAIPRASCLPDGEKPADDLGFGPTPLIVARVDADANPWRFKAEVMAHVRSIEQQYWSLVQQHARLWSSEKAVEVAEGVLKREQSELQTGRGTAADVAEAQQRLEQFRLDLVTGTSDVIATERQLRNLLGLPPADDRRIVPTSAPAEDRREPDWDDCRAKMTALQPDLVRQREVVQAAEGRALAALGVEWIAEALDLPSFCTEAAECARQALDVVHRQREYQTQILHQTTHSLARFCLEIDANYKQLQTAARLRAASAQRLEVQRASYEEGRITTDRYLDAVSKYASAVAVEAQYKTSYNISIVALEEAKGTLLAARNIAVAVGPGRCDPYRNRSVAGGSDPAVVPAGHEEAAPDRTGDADSSATTFSFQLSLGGKRPRVIRGELTITPK